METRGTHTSRTEWQKRVERWRDSGLSAEQFAAEFGINAGTLKYWKYRIGKEATGSVAADQGPRPSKAPRAASLVEVQATMITSSPFVLELGHRGYQPAFEDLFREAYSIGQNANGTNPVDLTHYLDEVQIQHVPEYGYGERIAVMTETSADRLSLARSYQAFFNHLTTLKRPWEAMPVETTQPRENEFGRILARRKTKERWTTVAV